MLDNKEKIIRSSGLTPTEKILAKICEKTFLKLWVYPNVYKKKGDELCDLLVVFENNIFIFSIKSIKFNDEKELDIAWKRWKKKAIDESIQQIQRAESWIIKNPEKIFLDAKCEKKLPITIDVQNLKIHRILVAHGAMEACKNHSEDNIAGSLAISYSDSQLDSIAPFYLRLDREKIYHILDSYNLEIILGELDTISDLTWYFEAKEEAIKRHNMISYCGEEDLLAYYLLSIDHEKNKYFINFKQDGVSSILIEEGFWEDFKKTEGYSIKKEADKISYLWDNLIQYMCKCILDKTLIIFNGIENDIDNNDLFEINNPLFEMAKEPRFFRRIISELMTNSINKCFFEKKHSIFRSFYPSFYSDKGYVFLQFSNKENKDYNNEYRPLRQKLLKISCGIEKNRIPKCKKIIGIARDFPDSKIFTTDCVLFDCAEWSQNEANEYINIDKNIIKMNRVETKITASEFSETHKIYEKKKHIKVGRNEKCPCHSGKKYKKCCLEQMMEGN